MVMPSVPLLNNTVFNLVIDSKEHGAVEYETRIVLDNADPLVSSRVLLPTDKVPLSTTHIQKRTKAVTRKSESASSKTLLSRADPKSTSSVCDDSDEGYEPGESPLSSDDLSTITKISAQPRSHDSSCNNPSQSNSHSSRSKPTAVVRLDEPVPIQPPGTTITKISLASLREPVLVGPPETTTTKIASTSHRFEPVIHELKQNALSVASSSLRSVSLRENPEYAAQHDRAAAG